MSDFFLEYKEKLKQIEYLEARVQTLEFKITGLKIELQLEKEKTNSTPTS